MRIISIDVGIKNLAYCILDYDVSTKIYKILQWDVINLCGEEHICNCPLKKKVKGKKKGKKNIGVDVEENEVINMCNKKATFIKGDRYFCQIHAKQSDFLLPNASLKKIKTWKIAALQSYALAQGLVFAENSKKDVILKEILNYLGEKTLERISQVSANEMTLVQMGVQLVKDFDNKLLDISVLDKIIIENQISPIANRMKTLQGMIAQYFIMRGNSQISFISSANKLKMFTCEVAANEADTNEVVANEVVANEVGTSKTTYTERKKAGVQIVKDLLVNNNETWLPTFLTHKKKDDLADAFLQGIWFLSKK